MNLQVNLAVTAPWDISFGFDFRMATSPNHKKYRIALSYKPYKNICDVIIEGCFTGKLVSILT